MFSDGEFVPIEDESIMQWIAEQIPEEDACINCGQTEGEVYSGPPHDHVCADCGRERPYRETICQWCRKEPRIKGADLCRSCIKHLEDMGLVGESKATFDLVECGVCGKTIEGGCKHWSIRG